MNPMSNFSLDLLSYNLFPVVRFHYLYFGDEDDVCFMPHCVSTASESPTGHGEEAVSRQLGELQETVRQTQVEGKVFKHD